MSYLKQNFDLDNNYKICKFNKYTKIYAKFESGKLIEDALRDSDELRFKKLKYLGKSIKHPTKKFYIINSDLILEITLLWASKTSKKQQILVRFIYKLDEDDKAPETKRLVKKAINEFLKKLYKQVITLEIDETFIKAAEDNPELVNELNKMIEIYNKKNLGELDITLNYDDIPKIEIYYYDKPNLALKIKLKLLKQLNCVEEIESTTTFQPKLNSKYLILLNAKIFEKAKELNIEHEISPKENGIELTLIGLEYKINEFLSEINEIISTLEAECAEAIENQTDEIEEEKVPTYNFSEIRDEYLKERKAAEEEWKKNESVELVKFPYWDDGKGVDSVEYIDVVANSTEWNTVEQKLNRTLKETDQHIATYPTWYKSRRHLRILKLERVQSYKFLERYSLKMSQIKSKYANRPDIVIPSLTKSMFHGSRAIDGKVLLATEEGLDLRYTVTHACGIGLYFAVYSDYSHPGYVYKLKYNGKNGFQIFLAEVITGLYCATRSTDKKPRRHPTYKKVKDDPKSKNIRGDSMSNSNPGPSCIMNIVCENCQAYPLYLITYEQT